MKAFGYTGFCRKLNGARLFRTLRLACAQFVIDSRQTQAQRFAADGRQFAFQRLATAECEALWVSPADVEAFWDEGGRHMMRTKSGREFSLREESWLKLLYGDGYEKAKAGA